MERSHRRADRAGDVVVARRAVGHHRSEDIERRIVAHSLLALHIHFDLVERDVSRPLDHRLHVRGAAAADQFPKHVKLRELRFVARIGQASRPHPVAERQRHIVLAADFEDFVERGVERILPVVLVHPRRQNRTAAADDAEHPLFRRRNMRLQQSGMDGHIVHALLGLFAHHVEDEGFGEVVHRFAAGEHLIHRNRADRGRTVFDDRTADLVDVAAGAEVHHGIRAVFQRMPELFQLLTRATGQRGVADVGVDLGLEAAPDADRHQSLMVDIGRNHHRTGGDGGADRLRRDHLNFGDMLHRIGNDAGFGLRRLRHATHVHFS